MESIYEGDMRVTRIAARVELTSNRGELKIEYNLENRGSGPLRYELTTGGRELQRFDLGQAGSARLARGPGPHPTYRIEPFGSCSLRLSETLSNQRRVGGAVNH